MKQETPKQHVELINNNIEEFDKAIELFKQETTLEQVAERLIFKTISGNYGITSSNEYDQVDGYFETYNEAYLTIKLKWQQERSYSEEEILDIIKQAYAMGRSNYTIEAFNNWFKQFKKK